MNIPLAGGFRGLPGRPLRGHQLVRHPRQEGDHHAKGHPARAKDPRRARLERPRPKAKHPSPFSQHSSFFKKSVARELLSRRNEAPAAVTAVAAPLLLRRKRPARRRLLGSPGLEKGAANSLLGVWLWKCSGGAAANQLKD